MGKSNIEWTDETWNVTTGCTRVSAGCDNCYAVAMTKRLAGIEFTKEKYSGLVNEGKGHFNGRIKLHEDELEKPLSWRKPRMVFVNSMSDLFHPNVPWDFVEKVFGIMAKAKDHTFQILTKRPDRMAHYINNLFPEKYMCDTDERRLGTQIFKWGEEFEWPLKNVWLGTSVEHQEAADERIPHLLQCPAAVRFLSCEPLLGEVNIVPFIGHNSYHCECGWHNTEMDLHISGYVSETKSPRSAICKNCGEGADIYRAVDWVIAGGESGHNARPMHPDWVRSLRDQCNGARVAFFFKQWGSWIPTCQMEDAGISLHDRDDIHEEILYNTGEVLKEDGSNWNDKKKSKIVGKVGKKKAGRLLDGREWNEMPGVS